jgi:hypothetical protein
MLTLNVDYGTPRIVNNGRQTMQYFVEAVCEQGDRHWSDVIESDGTTESVLDDARSFMSFEISDEFAKGLTLKLYRVEEDPIASAPATGGPVQLHNWSDGR